MALYVKFDCLTCENENCTGHGLPTTEKVCDGYKHTATNADRIRGMSDEDLAEHISQIFDCDHNKCPANSHRCYSCFESWLDWLKSPVEEVGE